MKTAKKKTKQHLTGEQIIKKKVDDAREMLARTDLSLLYEYKRQQAERKGKEDASSHAPCQTANSMQDRLLQIQTEGY